MSDSRSLQVWTRLVGLFGSALLSKFGDEPPPEWAAQIALLTDAQLRNGLDALLKAGRAHPPSLPEFLASCRNAREYADDFELSGALPAPKADRWTIEANHHLLAHVLREGTRRNYFDREQTLVLVKLKDAWADDCRADAIDGVFDVALQRQYWDDCMQRARDMGAVGGCAAMAA